MPAGRVTHTHTAHTLKSQMLSKIDYDVRDYGVYIPFHAIKLKEGKKNRLERTILTFVKFGTYKCVAISSADADGSCCCSNTGTSLKFAGFSMVKPFPCACNKKRLCVHIFFSSQISNRFDLDACVGEEINGRLTFSFHPKSKF